MSEEGNVNSRLVLVTIDQNGVLYVVWLTTISCVTYDNAASLYAALFKLATISGDTRTSAFPAAKLGGK